MSKPRQNVKTMLQQRLEEFFLFFSMLIYYRRYLTPIDGEESIKSVNPCKILSNPAPSHTVTKISLRVTKLVAMAMAPISFRHFNLVLY